MLDYGSNGNIVKLSGREYNDKVYIVLEYVKGYLLYDLCQKFVCFGEDYGRFFMKQLVEALEHMQSNNVAHRDLKLENILIDEDLNLKITDFGFATYKDITSLNSFRGSKTYMAPEIKENKTYNGAQADIFSAGVILWVLVQGFFPFFEAKPRSDSLYNLIKNKKYDQYLKQTGS